MIKRLFIKIPLYILGILALITVIIPLSYYIITGKSYLAIDSKYEEWIDNI